MQSVISYAQRGQGGDADYHGNFAPQLVEDLVQQFKPRQVIDPMAGSGTTADVCKRLGVPVWTDDLRWGFNVLRDEIPLGGNLAIMHPPYFNMVHYSGRVWGQQPNPHDLSRAPDYETFLKRLNTALYRLYESLRAGGHMAVLVGDLKRNGELYPIQRDMRWYGNPVNLVVKMQHNCRSDSRRYASRFIRIVHEYLVITQKAAGWFMPTRKTERDSFDTRRYAGQTWRSVVQTGLESLNSSAPLADIYTAVEDHAKVERSKSAGHKWKAQVRRILQVAPDFEHVRRGVWSLTDAPTTAQAA